MQCQLAPCDIFIYKDISGIGSLFTQEVDQDCIQPSKSDDSIGDLQVHLLSTFDHLNHQHQHTVCSCTDHPYSNTINEESPNGFMPPPFQELQALQKTPTSALMMQVTDNMAAQSNLLPSHITSAFCFLISKPSTAECLTTDLSPWTSYYTLLERRKSKKGKEDSMWERVMKIF